MVNDITVKIQEYGQTFHSIQKVFGCKSSCNYLTSIIGVLQFYFSAWTREEREERWKTDKFAAAA